MPRFIASACATAAGDTLWHATRGLPHGVEEPSIELGPDGMLYALTTPGHTAGVHQAGGHSGH